MNMTNIRMMRNTVADGKDVYAGELYAVPADISVDAARELVLMGRAVEVIELDEGGKDGGEGGDDGAH